jgi:phosphoglycerate dehydrogenase-like enzyme
MNKVVSFIPSWPVEVHREWFRNESFPNLSVEVLPKTCPLGEVCEALNGADAILTAPGTFLSRDILEAAKDVKLVQFASAGYDSIDLKVATELGIPVANNPGFPSIPVAEHAIMSMLVLMKYAAYSHSELAKGNWVQMELDKKIGEMPGKTVGILGLGSIGLEVAKRVRPFGVRILYNKRYRLSEAQERELGVEYASFDRLLKESDFLTIHVPLTGETNGLIGKEQIAKMKRGAFLVNTARGPIVDEAAVAEALREGRLAGAAFDVPRYGEGDIPKYRSTFEGVKNLLVTPHTSAMSPESTDRCVKGFTANIFRALNGEKLQNIVNGVWRQ